MSIDEHPNLTTDKPARFTPATLSLAVRLAGGMIIVGSLGPWATSSVPFAPVASPGTDIRGGWLTLLCGAAVMLFAHRSPVITGCLGGFAVLSAVYQMWVVTTTTVMGVQVASVGWGLVVLLLAGLAVVTIAGLRLSREHNP